MLHTEKLRARAAGGKLQNPFRLQKVRWRTPAGQGFPSVALCQGTPGQGAALAAAMPFSTCFSMRPERRQCRLVRYHGHSRLMRDSCWTGAACIRGCTVLPMARSKL